MLGGIGAGLSNMSGSQGQREANLLASQAMAAGNKQTGGIEDLLFKMQQQNEQAPFKQREKAVDTFVAQQAKAAEAEKQMQIEDIKQKYGITKMQAQQMYEDRKAVETREFQAGEGEKNRKNLKEIAAENRTARADIEANKLENKLELQRMRALDTIKKLEATGKTKGPNDARMKELGRVLDPAKFYTLPKDMQQQVLQQFGALTLTPAQ
jgi:hypothetical protein